MRCLLDTDGYSSRKEASFMPFITSVRGTAGLVFYVAEGKKNKWTSKHKYDSAKDH